MKPRLLTSAILSVSLLSLQSLSAQLIFEDTFSSQASLDNWVLDLSGDSTVELIEGSAVNVDGYLKVFDGDPAATPRANHDFGPTETGYLDVRMSGTKWAGSGVLILYSADGPLFSLSLNVSNSEIKGILNGLSDIEGRENDVFFEPLDLALESPTFPYGRDVRLTWSNGTLSMYYTGIDGTVYTRLDKAYSIPDATPSGVALAAGFDSANGKTGYYDFIKVYAGLPDNGPEPGEILLPYSQSFLALSSLNAFNLSGESNNVIQVQSGGAELDLYYYLHMEDQSTDSLPAAGLLFAPVDAGYVQARIAASGDYQDVLTLHDGTADLYTVSIATGPAGIAVHLNDSAEPLFVEPFGLNESTANVKARDMALVWNESGRADLHWESASGEQYFVPAVASMGANPVAGLTLSAGTVEATGNTLNVDTLKINTGEPDSGLGFFDQSLPYVADFSQAGDLFGWTVDGTYSLTTEPDGILTLIDDAVPTTSQMSRSFASLENGFVEILFRTTLGQQDILRLVSGDQTLYTVRALTTSSGYELVVNDTSGSSLVDLFINGETLADHAVRRLRISWDSGVARFELRSGSGGGASLSGVAALAAGMPDGLVLSAGTVEGQGHQLELDSLQIQNNSRTWESYVESHTTGGDLPLVDYSMAGYDLGRSGIPEVHELGLPYFDVTDYGAIPNDELSDREAIKAAIAAAEANEGGVVFFPPGVFLVNEEQGNLGDDRTYNAVGSYIILKGSGSGPGGTVLHMRQNLLPNNIDQAWSTPELFQIGATISPAFIAFTTGAMVTGSHTIEIASTQGLAPGDTIAFEAQAPVLNDYVLEGLSPRSDWTNIAQNGPVISEQNRIVAIDGNVLTLEAPLSGDLPAGLRVFHQPLYTHMGVEDLQFKGNFFEPFSHHGNNWSSVSNKANWDNDSRLYAAYMDGGYSAFRFSHAENSWCRRVRLTDVNSGVSFGNSYGNSIIECIIDGNTGHNTFAVRGGSHNLMGNTLDNTVPGNIGGHHGPSMSNAECLSVNWRHEAVAGPAFDFHAASPRANLVDHADALEFNGSGGAAQNLPNHLDKLTFWNTTIRGVWSDKLDFWDFSKTFTGMMRAVHPNLVGFATDHPYTINLDTLGIVESLDGLVYPESLYEGQLDLRHGSLPEWVNASKAAFTHLKALVYPAAGTDVPLFNLGLSAQQGGVIVSELANGTHPFLSIGTVTVEPAEGYVFTGWEGDLQHDASSFVLSMTSDISATATFAEQAPGPGDVFNDWIEYVDGWHWCELGWIYTGPAESYLWPYFYSATQDTWIYVAPYSVPNSGAYLYYPDPAVSSWFYFMRGNYPWFYRSHPADYAWYYFDEPAKAFVRFDWGVVLPIP